MQGDYEFGFGDHVRVTRTIRNDGTFPGLPTGKKLIRVGSTGFVRNVGVFLQDQIIYTVHFTKEDRHVGCRSQELIAASADWVETRFEFRDRVRMLATLRSDGATVADIGSTGEITKVLRDAPGGPRYQVHIDGRTFVVRESVLEPAETLAGPA